MKKLLFVAITILLVAACKQNTPDTITQISKDTNTDFTSFGDVITSDNVLSQDDMLASYQNLTPGDTLDVKFKAVVTRFVNQRDVGCVLLLVKTRQW